MDVDNLILTNMLVGQENLWDEMYEEEEMVSCQPKYDKLPAKFSRSRPWPTRSNLCCMHCGCVTARIPLFVPKNVVQENGPQGKELVFGVGGAVCSFPCAVAEVCNEQVASLRENRLSFLRLLVEEVLGPIPKSATPTVRALQVPPLHKEELARHGGRISDQEFQKRILSQEVLHESLLYAASNCRLTFR